MHPGSPQFVGATSRNEALLLDGGCYRMRRRSGLIWINSYAGIWLGVGKVARKDDVAPVGPNSRPHTALRHSRPAKYRSTLTTRHDREDTGDLIARSYQRVDKAVWR